MVFICTPDFSGSCGQGYTSGPWASADIFGTPVPLKVKRYRLDPGVQVRRHRARGHRGDGVRDRGLGNRLGRAP